MEKKLNKKRVKKNKKPKNVLVITTIYVICFSVIAGVFAYTRINKYEEGVCNTAGRLCAACFRPD